MATQPTGYQPIDCDFHDRIEAFSTLKQRVRIAHEYGTGSEVKSEGTIVDVFTSDRKEEFLRLANGAVIRLDRIKSVEAAPE